MNFGQKYGLVFKTLSSIYLMSYLCVPGYAQELAATPPAVAEDNAVSQAEIPLAATNANWIFSGSVSTETGETYEYFFQAKRKQNAVQATISLVDAQTKAVIFMQTADTQLTAEAQPDHWTIGDIFLRYNTINHSWVFGLKKENQIGFNFKVDIINRLDHSPKIRQVRDGVMMTMVQTGQVNGHIQLKEDASAQFVTGKNAWFREVVVRKASAKLPALQGLLCHFNDGSGLYSMKVGDTKIKPRTYAGSYTAEGAATNISKSIRFDLLDSGLWRVNVPSSKLQFDLNDVLKNQPIVLGFVDQKKKSGFCVISKEEDVG
ncbi:MAG: hypothetical protein ACO1N3_01885 [Gammaproteobacteria bacterium]